MRMSALAVAFVSLLLVYPAAAQQPPRQPAPPVKDLGGDRYQVGNTLVDKGRREFRISGRVIRIEAPLEYLAVIPRGAKAYESLLELDTNAFEFQVSCILIGLDDAQTTKPRFQFDTTELKGQHVEILAEIGQGPEAVTVPASDLLLLDGEKLPEDEWVYVGSGYSGDDVFLAHQLGTLIGFVHDPASVVDHRGGIGIGNYGGIAGNTALLPAVGTPVTLVIRNKSGEPAE